MNKNDLSGNEQYRLIIAIKDYENYVTKNNLD